MNSPQRSYDAVLSPSGRHFSVFSMESVLAAALRAGIALPYGCASGSCGDCLARIMRGTVKQINHRDYVIPEKLRIDGYHLTCCVTATSDIEVQIDAATTLVDLPKQHIQGRVCGHETNNNVHIFTLKISRGKILRFFSGQSVVISLGAGHVYTRAIGSCPCTGNFIQLHLHANDPLTEELTTIGRAKRISIEGPVGDFVFHQPEPESVVFLVQGVGFAPVKSLVEHLINVDHLHPIYIFRTISETKTPYLDNLCRSWHDAIDNLTYRKLDSSSFNDFTLVAKEFLHDARIFIAGTHDFVGGCLQTLSAEQVETKHIQSFTTDYVHD